MMDQTPMILCSEENVPRVDFRLGSDTLPPEHGGTESVRLDSDRDCRSTA